MKKIYSFLVLFCFTIVHSVNSQVCDVNGNLLIFSNYDGGVLNINVDQNIPDLKIGIVSYEACSVTISGTFVANVSGVIYAGYNSNSSNCTTSITSTSISGVSGSIIQLLTAPAAGLPDPNGNANIICAYDCDTSGNQGGCNTVMQVAGFFLNQWPGSSLRYHHTQYGCWNAANTFAVSGQGNCCIQPFALPVASMMASADSICVGDCVTYYNSSSGTQLNPAQWSFVSGTPSSGTGDSVTVCYSNAGTFPVGITVSNPAGSDNQVYLTGITVVALPVTPSILQSDSLLYFSSSPNLSYQWLLNGNPIIGANNDSLLALSNGNYTVVVTNNFGCTKTSSVFNLSNLAVNDRDFENLSIVPNPFHHSMVIKGIPGASNYRLCDISGKLIGSGNLSIGDNLLTFSELAPGIYFLQVKQSSGKLLNARLIKQ